MLLCTYCVAYGVRCVAMRLLHLLCFGLYDVVAVSVGVVVERLFRGHRCRDEIQGAADEAIKNRNEFPKAAARGLHEFTGAAMKIWESCRQSAGRHEVIEIVKFEN